MTPREVDGLTLPEFAALSRYQRKDVERQNRAASKRAARARRRR